MSDELMKQGLAPYVELFPQTQKGMLEISLPKKVGKARAGVYLFVEIYCVQKGCDCRQVILQVFNDKGKPAACIDFCLDIGNPFAPPILNDSGKQSAAAEGLLEIFIDMLNDAPDWYRGMCRRYRAVRKKVDGFSYKGEPFPKHRPVVEDNDESLPDFETLLQDIVGTLSSSIRGQKNKQVESRQQNLFADDFTDPELSVMAELVDRYRSRDLEDYDDHRERQQQLRGCLYRYESAAEEFAELLIELFIGEDEKEIDAALRLLADALDILRTDLERQRPDAAKQMHHWQMALAGHIFAEGVDFELGAEVTRVLLDSRVEILPELHEANTSRMLAGLEHDGMADFSPEQALDDLLVSLDELEIKSSFELVDALLQMLAIGDATAQVTLCTQLFFADLPLARSAAVLMLFHPHANVRTGVAEFLAQTAGQNFTPESLRRLIVSRNWFPEALRKNLDQAIANARRARIECAPLPQGMKKQVYASAIDGAGAQSLQIVLQQGKSYLSCSIMLKKGFGVADAFLIPFPNKRELNLFLKMMRQEAGGTEVATDYPDRRLCQALADGAGEGKVPSHWLVAIAEQLGSDQWKADPLDARRELAMFRESLQGKGRKMLLEPVRQYALQQSADWPEQQHFAHSWFEDDAEVDRRLEAIFVEDARIDPMEPIIELLDQVIEPRRELWLERLVLTTGWLKAAKRPPVLWEHMFHVAEAVADKSVPLREIPLMIAVAENSVGAFMGRKIEEEDLF